MKLSVLVPIYNAERFLEPFMRSLASQCVEDIEFVFLDDCSQDDSVEVLKRELAKCGLSSMARLLFHKENRGVSEARQTLLDAAKGEYVIYADPDDEIDPGMYEGLLAKAYSTNADFVWEDFYEGDVGCRNQKFAGDIVELIRAILRGRIHGATWNKLIRRQFILESGARFLEGRVCLCEDMDFICQVLAANPKVAYHDGCHYHYRTVCDSATHGLSEASFRSLMAVENHLARILPAKTVAEDLAYWRKSNRLAAFLSNAVGDKFFYDYLENVRDLSGLPTNIILKGLFWFAARGGRRLMLPLYQLISHFAR